MDIKDIILIILVFVNIYLVYKVNFENKSEKFGPTQPSINQMIASTYKVDLDAMRNLGQLASDILTIDDTLTIPATTTVATDLNINGNIVIDNNLTIAGSVTFTNKDTVALEIFPKYMVIAWANNTIPKGWAICDGQMYSLDGNNNAVVSTTGTNTPDLRGRFVLGAGVGATDMNGTALSARTLNNNGGEESHKLLLPEIPSHNHPGISNSNSNNTCVCKSGICICAPSNDGTGFNGGDANGNTIPHNNMPPFWVLYYIMKL